MAEPDAWYWRKFGLVISPRSNSHGARIGGDAAYASILELLVSNFNSEEHWKRIQFIATHHGGSDFGKRMNWVLQFKPNGLID